MKHRSLPPLLDDFYRQYLVDQDSNALIDRVMGRYSVGTLERLARHPQRLTRRAAVLVLGQVADFASNSVLGAALIDQDRGVRTLAEAGIHAVWCRSGSASHRRRLATLIRLNAARRYRDAVRHATRLLSSAADVAEVWNQRAVAYFSLGEFEPSRSDCLEALDRNPFHFGAASGLGHCELQLGDQQAALDGFRLALKLNPGLEQIRVQIQRLQQLLKNQDG